MAANTISLTFKLEELNGGFKQVTADAEGFKRVVAIIILLRPTIFHAIFFACFLLAGATKVVKKGTK